MRGVKGERTLMRVHVEEQDKHEGRPLYEAIFELLRRSHFAGATAFRAIEGFGASDRVHEAHVWSMTTDVPVVIECVESDEKIQAILPQLDAMIGGGLITLERVRVILYRKDLPAEERDEHASMEIPERLGPDA
jgi:PII-like signaling protein